MKIDLKAKIHNKFEIFIKDVTTGEIVQSGKAENIVLDNIWDSIYFIGESFYIGSRIIFGRGTGTLTASRTTLFDAIGYQDATTVETVVNQPPLASYTTKKIVISPSEYVGETFTEVGLGSALSETTIFNHALFKDSEGNPLALGPKTGTQEITIYSTFYFQPNFPDGITLPHAGVNNKRNALVFGATGATTSSFRKVTYAASNPGININNTDEYDGTHITGVPAGFAYTGNKVFTQPTTARIPTSLGNTKIKTTRIGGEINQSLGVSNILDINFETLAQNNSTLWPGYNFDNRQIGVGTGAQTVFNLTWDEARLDKAKAVYVDGIEQISGVTWTAGSITFDIAPADAAVITADYWVDYVPKDTDHVLDFQLSITFGEGAA